MTAPLFDGTQACADADLELFFPTVGGRHAGNMIEQAKAICGRCPFIGPCLEYAITTPAVSGRFLSGVWGGTTSVERHEIRNRRREAA